MAKHLPNEMKARVAGPEGVCGVGFIELYEDGRRNLADRDDGKKNQGKRGENSFCFFRFPSS